MASLLKGGLDARGGDGLEPMRSRSRTICSTCRGSASYSIPSSVHRTTLFNTRTSLSSPEAGPSLADSVSSYFSSMAAFIQSNDALGPEEVKSSPCSLQTMFLRVRLNMHALASPLTKPSSSRRPEYSQCHPSAAALVPYRWTSSIPTMSRAVSGSS